MKLIMNRNLPAPDRYQWQRYKYRVLNSEGIALITVLILTAVAMGVMAALIYMVTIGTQASGLQKQYRTALEAGIGGKDVTFRVIDSRGNPNISGINLTFSDLAGCMAKKLNSATSAWGACDSSSTITPGTASSYDATFNIGTGTVYQVYMKVIDTTVGNSSPGGSGSNIRSEKTGVVISAGAAGSTGQGSGSVAVESIPYLYTIEVLAQKQTNPSERAKLNIVYQY